MRFYNITLKRILLFISLFLLVLSIYIGNRNYNKDSIEKNSSIFSDTNSTIMVITKGQIGNKLEKDDGYVQAKIEIINKNGERITDSGAKIKVRGNTTSEGEKKPYNIKFSIPVNLLNSTYERKYSILADCYDATMMRNYLFLKTASEIGLPYTPSAEYVELFIDGYYKGVFLACDSIEIGKERVDLNVAKGDFLFEYEFERNEGRNYFVTPSGWRFAILEPKECNNKEKEYYFEKLESLDLAVSSGNYEEVTSIVDVESFAKYYVLSEYAKPLDFGYSSVKFFFKEDKFYAGPVWDFDLSSGNSSFQEYYNKNGNSYEDLWCQRHIYEKLYKYTGFQELVKNIFERYYTSFENLYVTGGLIDKTLEMFGPIIQKNYTSTDAGGAGWIVNKKYAGLEKEREETYIDNVIYLKEWLQSRLFYLSEHFK